MYSGILKGHQGTPRVFRSPFNPWVARFVTTCLGAPKGTRERALGGSRRGGPPRARARGGRPWAPPARPGGAPPWGGPDPPQGGVPGEAAKPVFCKDHLPSLPGRPQKGPLGALGPCINIYSTGSFVQGCRGFGPAGGKVGVYAETYQHSLNLGGLELLGHCSLAPFYGDPELGDTLLGRARKKGGTTNPRSRLYGNSECA